MACQRGGCAGGGSREPSTDPEGASADQGAGARVEAQGKALAETAALLVLSKKLSAIYGEGADEGSVWKIAKPWPNTSSRPRRRVRGSHRPVNWSVSTGGRYNGGGPEMAWSRVTSGPVPTAPPLCMP